VFTIKTPELRRQTIVAAMYGTFDKNETEARFYQASVYAWNAFRENKTITSIKYDTKKGFYAVAA
jgi:hypothetical protein